MANSQVSASRTEGLRSFLHKLRESSPEEFASTATSGACVDLGFTKAMFSWVDGTSWRPESVYISPDLDDRFDALIDAVDGSAVPLLRAPREADLVRYRRPYVLGKESYRQAYRPLIDLSRPSAYAAAPILAGGRTVRSSTWTAIRNRSPTTTWSCCSRERISADSPMRPSMRVGGSSISGGHSLRPLISHRAHRPQPMPETIFHRSPASMTHPGSTQPRTG